MAFCLGLWSPAWPLSPLVYTGWRGWNWTGVGTLPLPLSWCWTLAQNDWLRGSLFLFDPHFAASSMYLHQRRPLVRSNMFWISGSSEWLALRLEIHTRSQVTFLRFHFLHWSADSVWNPSLHQWQETKPFSIMWKQGLYPWARAGLKWEEKT